jgi:hypothetical protein
VTSNGVRRGIAPAIEFGCACLALGVGVIVVVILAVAPMGVPIRRGHIAAIALSVLAGPLLAVVGAWLDGYGGQPAGIMLIVFAAFLAFDGMIATYFLAVPVFLLVLAALAVALVRRKRDAGSAEGAELG